MWYINNPYYIAAYFEKLINQQFNGFSIVLLLEMTLVFSWVAFAAEFIYTRKTGTKFSIKAFITLVLLIFYACFMFQIAIYRREPGTEHRVRTDIDLGSLHGDFVAEMQVGYCLLNILFFVPWGIFLGIRRMLMNREEAGIKTVVMSILVSFIASAVIELSQLVTGTGIFELTDILMNTLGGTAGVICAKLMDKILRSERNE